MTTYTGQDPIQMTAKIRYNAKLYFSKTHDKKNFWLVYQRLPGKHIFGKRFDEFGAKEGHRIKLLTPETAVLQLYGASGRVTASTVELDITYKKSEDGVEKTFIASFNEKGE